MRYRRDYQETHDIDWFFRYEGKAYHAASNGGMLPDSVDSTKNRDIQMKLEEMESMYEVAFAETNYDYYGSDADLSSFEFFAARGFISLDRIEETNRYRIVASPKNGGSIENEELLALMPELEEKDIIIR